MTLQHKRWILLNTVLVAFPFSMRKYHYKGRLGIKGFILLHNYKLKGKVMAEKTR